MQMTIWNSSSIDAGNKSKKYKKNIAISLLYKCYFSNLHIFYISVRLDVETNFDFFFWHFRRKILRALFDPQFECNQKVNNYSIFETIK